MVQTRSKTSPAAASALARAPADADGPLMAWLGTVVTPAEHGDVAAWLTQALGLTVPPRIVGPRTTRPDRGDAKSGGREDFFFSIAAADVPAAAVRRLRFPDIKWAQDLTVKYL